MRDQSSSEADFPESLLSADAAARTALVQGFAGAEPSGSEDASQEASYAFAGFWIRVGATLLDGLFLTGISFLIFNPLRRAFTAGPDVFSYIDLLEIVFDFAYAILLTWWTGQTLGKLITGIRVVNARQHRSQLTLGQVLLREVVGKFLSALPLGLGYLWAGWNRKKQGWHDLIARTYVIRDSKRT
ncbi:RDD family protein [Brevibacillus borstelensis]|uniref:RDD family protein n=1 Tax=Brevibacillus borstelensis TaxID=45462 RepID=UPI00046A7760|nr:RDD family protein [Brevibacillus borstelensis]